MKRDCQQPGAAAQVSQFVSSVGAIARAAAILGEAAALAHRADRTCAAQGSAMEDRNPDDVQVEVDTLRATFQRLGWLVDMAAMELGGEAYRGDAAAWMLPGLPGGGPQTGRQTR